MGNIALEIPLRRFSCARRGQGDDAADPGVEVFGDALDDAALARGVAAFKNNDDLQALVLDPGLQFHELHLQPEKLGEIRPAPRPQALFTFAVVCHAFFPKLPAMVSQTSGACRICSKPKSTEIN